MWKGVIFKHREWDGPWGIGEHANVYCWKYWRTKELVFTFLEGRGGAMLKSVQLFCTLPKIGIIFSDVLLILKSSWCGWFEEAPTNHCLTSQSSPRAETATNMIHTLAQIDRLWNVLELFNSILEWSDYSRIHTLICIESQFANDLHLHFCWRIEIGLKASIADILSWGRERWHVNTAIKSLLSISCRRKDRLICEDGAGKDIGGSDQAKRERRGGRGRAAKKLCAGILKEAIPNLGHTWWWHGLNIFSDGIQESATPHLT